MTKIKASNIWKCEKCGFVERSSFKQHLDEVAKRHTCHPILYNLIQEVNTDMRRDSKIINNNGAAMAIAKHFGITKELASAILNEMETLGLAEDAIPFRV